MQKLLIEMITAVVGSLIHNWFPLSLAILVAAIMKVYIDPEKLKQALLKRPTVSIWASVGFGAFTPLCACGTMAVIIAMLTTTLPWGPIMAFLTSSPLMSPEGFIMLAGIINLEFAIALTLASIIIGLGSGYATHIIEKKTGWLKNQTRFAKNDAQSCACSEPALAQKHASYAAQTCGCSEAAAIPEEAHLAKVQLCCVGSAGDNQGQFNSVSALYQVPMMDIGVNIYRGLLKLKWQEMADGLINVGLKQIVLFYSIFVAVGFLINYFVPTSIIVALFSGKNVFAVPLAALIGLPIYVSGESSIPLINALMAGGAGAGAMLAFMITGPGTSAWVVAGLMTFLKKRAIGLYVLFLVVGGISLGYLYDLFLVMWH